MFPESFAAQQAIRKAQAIGGFISGSKRDAHEGEIE
jgi:hypothetical protein